jgi:hypothetical protein
VCLAHFGGAVGGYLITFNEATYPMFVVNNDDGHFYTFQS